MWNLKLPLLMATLVSMFFGQTVLAQEISLSQNLTKNLKISSLRQISLTATNATRKITQLSQLEPIVTSARTLLVQSPTPVSEIVEVTQVKVNPTSKGVEVILQTTKGQQLQLINRSFGNNFITDIPNAQLRLASGDAFTFRSDKPIAGVSEITVSNFDANTIRLTVTGEVGKPVVELYDSPDEGIIFSVASALSATPSQQPPQTQQSQASQPQNQTQPTQPSDQGNEPIELIVTGEQDGYREPNASSATKTDTPLRDIPGSIQTINKQVIEDQRAFREEDALRNVSGVVNGNAFGDRIGTFYARGFTLRRFQDGFYNDYNAARANPDTANIERIEVLKGPASILYGTAEPGGIINTVSKKPLFEPYSAVDLTFGSYSFYRPSVDISGPLNSSKTVAYRLNVAYENAGSFRDFVNSERIFTAPALAVKIDPNTTLTLGGSYLHDTRPLDTGLVAIGNRPANLPFSRALFDPQRPGLEFDEKQGYIYLDHKFNQNLSLRTAVRVSTAFERRDSIIVAGDVLSDNQTLPLRLSVNNQYYETYTLQNDLISKFKTGSIAHTVLLGIELAKQTALDNDYQDARGASINIFNPVYGVSFPSIQDSAPYTQDIRTFGIYLQDQITLLDNLKLLVGGRFDTYTEKDQDFSVAVGSITNGNANQFTPRIGIVYQPIELISLYASYSKSFVPQVGVSANRTPFQPEKGKQYEVGVKGELLQGRLSSTLALYDITRSNVLTNDPNNPDFSIQVGEQHSQGLEIDVVGKILPEWNIITSYAYTNATITKDNTYPVGNRLDGVPYNTFSLWTTYRIQNGPLSGLGFGTGAFFVGNREGDLDHSFELPGYTRVDAAVYYTRGHLKAALNFKNLLDVKYFDASTGRDSIAPGAPFTVLGTFSWQF
ncbi:MAG: TonB-dependent siderophore receptor [Nostoc sp.]|uniref:TonB-dependent siderophore receptor n=1 Tax=Nostoc sp. TaxID=1180 RepID=UPI002FF97B68